MQQQFRSFQIWNIYYCPIVDGLTFKIFAKSAAVLVLQVEQPKYVDVNQVLYPKERGADISYKNDGWDWKNLYLPTLKPVSTCNISNYPSGYMLVVTLNNIDTYYLIHYFCF